MSPSVPKLAYDLSRDVQTLAAMASNLTPYMYEDAVFGHLSSDLPRLTLGGVLLRLYRLSRLEAYLDDEQRTLVRDAQINFEAERARWAVHYEQKLQRELETRVHALEQFLADCNREQGCAAEYPMQAEKRTMIAHLREEAAEHDVLSEEIASRIGQLDALVRQLTQSGPFVYTDERLTEAYPQARFWWLYRHIAENRRS